MKSEPLYLTEPFDQNMFETVISTANAVRDETHQAAGKNIKKAQVKQKRDFDCRHLSSSTVNGLESNVSDNYFLLYSVHQKYYAVLL